MRRITSLQLVDKRKQSFLIELNSLPWREVDVEVILKMHLHVGDKLSPEQQSQIDRENEYVLARRRAVNFCVKQPRSQRDVLRMLARKNVKDAVIERVMRELVKQHLLRDREVARRQVRRAERAKTGPLKAQEELAQRGVSEELINEEIQPILDPEWQKSGAMELAKKRLTRLSNLDDKTKRRRLSDYLARRGFEGEIIHEVTENILREKE